MQMADIETRYKGENVKIKKKAEIELAEAGQQINQVMNKNVLPHGKV